MILRFLLIAWTALALASAPDGKSDIVKEIRAVYAATQQRIAEMDLEEHMRSQLTTTIQRNVNAIGIQKQTLTCFFDDFREMPWEEAPDFKPYFLTRKFNAAAHKFYQEYLFDAATGRILFIFLQGDSYEESGKKDETRYYFGPDGALVHEIVKGERLATPENAVKQARLFYDSVKKQLDACEGAPE
ncbi:MAG: hypothetical protein K6G79_04675 [Bacteroidales bacterium]|nr:hypothetical protein [Bacteroidales bacterium]